jgi:general secretion pathway protein J
VFPTKTSLLRRGQLGLTLIELLVAITVLAVVAVLGWRGLDGIVRARLALTAELEHTRGMQLTFAQMQSDFARIASENDISNHASLLAESERITMIRTVFADNQPSRVQVIAYRLRDGKLTRQEWTPTRDLKVLDATWQAALSNTDTKNAVLLQSDVASMNVQSWFPDNSGWQTTPVGTPIGIQVMLQLNDRNNSMTKIFLLGAT